MNIYIYILKKGKEKVKKLLFDKSVNMIFCNFILSFSPLLVYVDVLVNNFVSISHIHTVIKHHDIAIKMMNSVLLCVNVAGCVCICVLRELCEKFQY